MLFGYHGNIFFEIYEVIAIFSVMCLEYRRLAKHC